MKSTALLLTVSTLFISTIVSAQPHQPSDDVKGFTEPYRSIEIAAPEMGTLSKISVEEGQAVNSGSILANLNEDVLAASLAMATESKESKGKLNSAMAELQMQTEKLKKINGLFERRHASQAELDRAKSQWEVAKAQVQAVQDDLRIKAFEIKRIQAQIEQKRLRTPINGIVTRVFKDEGEFVSANDPVVATVVQLDPLLVVFSVPQESASQLNAGQTLPLKIENSKTVNGVVEFVSPTADAQSGTCRVKIKIDNPDHTLSSGLACYLIGVQGSDPQNGNLMQASSPLNSSPLHSPLPAKK